MKPVMVGVPSKLVLERKYWRNCCGGLSVRRLWLGEYFELPSSDTPPR